MNRPIIICEDSFKLTGIGLIVFLKHQEKGLVKGLIIKSATTCQMWEIDSRILYYHSLDKQVVFENESKKYMSKKKKAQLTK